MQDHKEMSSVEVIEHGLYEDQMHPISCSVTAGVNNSDRMHGLHCSSLRQQLSEDRTQQLWTMGRTRQWRPIESREVLEQ